MSERERFGVLFMKWERESRERERERVRERGWVRFAFTNKIWKWVFFFFALAHQLRVGAQSE